MRRRLGALLVTVGVLATVLTTIGSAPASASHPGCYLDGRNGSYTDNYNYIMYPAYWLNWGAWDSDGQYIAHRYTQDWFETYHQWRPADEGIHWASTSGNELLYRYTSQQRAGYGWRNFGFSVYHCDPR